MKTDKLDAKIRAKHANIIYRSQKTGQPIEPLWLEPNGVGFKNFLASVKEPPTPTAQLRMFDRDRGYVRGNMSWVEPDTHAPRTPVSPALRKYHRALRALVYHQIKRRELITDNPIRKDKIYVAMVIEGMEHEALYEQHPEAARELGPQPSTWEQAEVYLGVRDKLSPMKDLPAAKKTTPDLERVSPNEIPLRRLRTLEAQPLQGIADGITTEEVVVSEEGMRDVKTTRVSGTLTTKVKGSPPATELRGYADYIETLVGKPPAMGEKVDKERLRWEDNGLMDLCPEIQKVISTAASLDTVESELKEQLRWMNRPDNTEEFFFSDERAELRRQLFKVQDERSLAHEVKRETLATADEVRRAMWAMWRALDGAAYAAEQEVLRMEAHKQGVIAKETNTYTPMTKVKKRRNTLLVRAPEPQGEVMPPWTPPPDRKFGAERVETSLEELRKEPIPDLDTSLWETDDES